MISAADFLKWVEVFNIPFGGSSSGYVTSITGTANEIDVDNTAPQVPVLSLSSTIDAPGTLTVQSTTAVNAILDDDTMAADSPTALVTQQSVVAYIAGTAGGAGGSTNDVQYNNSGSLDGLTTANNGTLITSAAGVPSISSTLPSAVQTNITAVGILTSLQVDNLNLNGNTISSTDTNGNIEITPDGTGRITSAKDINGSTALSLSNVNAGSSARALFLFVNGAAAGDNAALSLNGKGYTGVSGWADRLVFSTGSTIANGINVNPVSGGFAVSTTANNSENLIVNAAGNTALTGSLTASQTAGIIGTTTNNNADTGSVGEFKEESVARSVFPALTTNTAYDVTSIELTAGDWDVYGGVGFVFSATTTSTQVICAVSSTSATLPANHYWSTVQPRTGNGLLDTSMAVVPQRFSLSGTTTIYLIAKAVFATSTAFTFGTIEARRAR